MGIFIGSLNPYNKSLNDKYLRNSTIFQADINSVVYTRNLKENEALNKKIDELKDAFEALDEIQHEDKKELEKEFVKVYFTDVAASSITQIALSKEAVVFLIREFGAVYERKDGSFLLDGESNAYVRGWYNEIARNQNYLKADANKDGIIDDEEKLNLKSLFMPREYAISYDNPFLCVSNMKSHRAFSELSTELRQKYKETFTSDTLNLALNKVLSLDRDFDGVLKYTDYDNNTYHNFIKDIFDEILKDNPLYGLDQEELYEALEQYKQEIKKEVSKRNEEKLKVLEDKDNGKGKIYAKLLSSMNLSTLSPEEKNLAKKHFPKLVQMLENNQNSQDFNNLFKDLINTRSFTIDKILDLKA